MKDTIFKKKQNSFPLLVYSLLALLVLLPMLAPGYILTLDMVFGPHMRMPDQVSSSFVFYAGLHFLNYIFSAQVLEKIILFLILFLSGLGMHRLAGCVRIDKKNQIYSDKWGAYTGGLFYMINPFTYDRFMAGQYTVLLGYALLPWFVQSLLRLLTKPGWRAALVTACWAVAVSIVSIHSVGLMVIVTLVTIAVYGWRRRRDAIHLQRIMKYGLVGMVIFLAASSYWLIPLAQGRGDTATAITSFDAGDQQAFATVGSSTLGKFSNIIRLQGFWLEPQGLYILPRDIVPAWGLIALTIWVLVFTGIVSMWRKNQRYVVALFGLVILLGWILAAGALSGWLVRYMPLLAGYREPQKFAALVALGYALFVGHGISVVMRQYVQDSPQQSRLKASMTVIVLLFLLVNFTRPMFWGFDGQLTPRHYPADWFVVNEKLDQDHSNFKVLFLPWHLYMSYHFTGRIIGTPAIKFFDKPIIASQDPEFKNASSGKPSPEQSLLDDHLLRNAPDGDNLGSQLTSLNVKYVLLAKDFDYKSYGYLANQKDLQLIQESATLKLYRNTAFKGGR